MPEDLEPGRPAVEGVFVAWVVTAIAGLLSVHVLARWLPPWPPPGVPLPAIPLTLSMLYVSLAFAVAQAILPGPKSAGCVGLLIPLSAAIAVALRGLGASAVVGVLFAGVFLTPAAYYLAIRLSFPYGGLLRRRPLVALLCGAAGTALVIVLARWLTWLADPATHGRFWRA